MILNSDIQEGLLLKPVRYPWAMELFDQANRNTWFPEEIMLDVDVADFKKMTDDERHAVQFIMSYFSPSELLVNKSLALGVYPYLNAPEAHMYLAKQMWEEANHSKSFEYVLQTFPLDRDACFQAHVNVPSIQKKEQFEMTYLKRMTERSLDITTVAGKKDFVRNLVATNIIMEGIWFQLGFMVSLSFRQRNLLRNFGSMISWVFRDESLHLKFGINLILTVLAENPELQTEDFANEIEEMIVDAVQVEMDFIQDMLPNGVIGISPQAALQYIQYLADRRLEELGLEARYHVTNPAKWMAAADVLELVSFFEVVNTQYERGVTTSISAKEPALARI